MSPPDPEEEALAALDRSDYSAALTVLMDAYGQPIYRFCRQMVDHDEALADDAHQMTFLQAWQGFEFFSRRSSLRTWLYSIARHRCLDAVKSHRRRRRRIETVPELPDEAAPDCNAEERLAAGARRSLLQRCLGELAPRVRLAVLLRFQENLSYAQIASISDERPPTLQARVARALPVLRRCLEQAGTST